VLSKEAFSDVLRSGSRRPRGMPSYEQLSDAQLEALRHYIREQSWLAPRRSEALRYRVGPSARPTLARILR
jgi:quinohemoprotein ethanol dehydrogenase